VGYGVVQGTGQTRATLLTPPEPKMTKIKTSERARPEIRYEISIKEAAVDQEKQSATITMIGKERGRRKRCFDVLPIAVPLCFQLRRSDRGFP